MAFKEKYKIIETLDNLNKNKSLLLQILGSLISGVIFFYIVKYILFWVPNLAIILDYIKEPLQSSIPLRLVGLIIIFIISVLLFKLKQKLIVIFGMLELAGGTSAVWAAFSKNHESSIIYSLALGSGIFLIVKGIENVISQNNKVK